MRTFRNCFIVFACADFLLGNIACGNSRQIPTSPVIDTCQTNPKPAGCPVPPPIRYFFGIVSHHNLQPGIAVPNAAFPDSSIPSGIVDATIDLTASTGSQGTVLAKAFLYKIPGVNTPGYNEALQKMASCATFHICDTALASDEAPGSRLVVRTQYTAADSASKVSFQTVVWNVGSSALDISGEYGITPQ